MPNKILMICGEICTRCAFLKPHLEKDLEREKKGSTYYKVKGRNKTHIIQKDQYLVMILI